MDVFGREWNETGIVRSEVLGQGLDFRLQAPTASEQL